MKKAHRVLREILVQSYERGSRFLSQKSVAESCEVSLGTVNPVISKLAELGTVERRPQGFRILDAKKILQYWSAHRDLRKDIVYSAYASGFPEDIEEQFSEGVIFTAYSGYRMNFGSTPTDYPEVYIYGGRDKVARGFRQKKEERNIFVLELGEHLEKVSRDKIAPLVQVYVDLWQLPPPADRFLEKLGQELKSARVGVEAVFESSE